MCPFAEQLPRSTRPLVQPFPKEQDVLRQVDSRRSLRIHSARLQVQARDAARRGHPAFLGPVPGPPCVVEEAQRGRHGQRKLLALPVTRSPRQRLLPKGTYQAWNPHQAAVSACAQQVARIVARSRVTVAQKRHCPVCAWPDAVRPPEGIDHDILAHER